MGQSFARRFLPFGVMGQCVPVLKNQLFDDFVPALPRMDGKSVAVTGCTSGTGKIFAKARGASIGWMSDKNIMLYVASTTGYGEF